jgi:hypothetical protein
LDNDAAKEFMDIYFSFHYRLGFDLSSIYVQYGAGEE